MSDVDLVVTFGCVLFTAFHVSGYLLNQFDALLPRRSSKRLALIPCTTWWSPFYATKGTNEPPYSIGIACRAPCWTDATCHRCRRRRNVR